MVRWTCLSWVLFARTARARRRGREELRDGGDAVWGAERARVMVDSRVFVRLFGGRGGDVSR